LIALFVLAVFTKMLNFEKHPDHLSTYCITDTGSFVVNELIKTAPDVLNRVQLRALSGPVIKTPNLMGVLPTCSKTACVAGGAIFLLKDEVFVILVAQFQEPRKELLRQSIEISILININVKKD
jgi:hypothetical protein